MSIESEVDPATHTKTTIQPFDPRYIASIQSQITPDQKVLIEPPSDRVPYTSIYRLHRGGQEMESGLNDCKGQTMQSGFRLQGNVRITARKPIACSRVKSVSGIKRYKHAESQSKSESAAAAVIPTEGLCSNLECLKVNATRICKKCKKVFYCDTKCRRKNQKMHSAICK